MEDVLIEKNRLDRYFDKSIPIDLWRALNKKSDFQPFDFVEKGFILSNRRPRGLSTFDKKGLPEGLAIVQDEYNSRFEATHYTIAPAYDMPLSQFKNKLMQLAKKLIKEAA